MLRAEPLLDLGDAVRTGGEQGLLGLAFSPDPSSDRFFVNFTNRSGDTVVARFRRMPGNRLTADPSSRFDLRWSTGQRVIHQPYSNHNGGNLVFGPDGYLYVGLGDGGSGNDPENRAQDGATLLGKMLRIDVSVGDGDERGYRVPPDNPFLRDAPAAALPETWAFGLRNPWRYSFDDPALGGTGALLVADVGQGGYQEVDYEPPGGGGRNYGWRLREGAHPNTPGTPAFLPLTDPLFDYDHQTGIAVVGGFVYRGRALGPEFFGRYFYADLNARVWSVGLAQSLASGRASVTDRIEHTAELGERLGLAPSPLSASMRTASCTSSARRGAGCCGLRARSRTETPTVCPTGGNASSAWIRCQDEATMAPPATRIETAGQTSRSTRRTPILELSPQGARPGLAGGMLAPEVLPSTRAGRPPTCSCTTVAGRRRRRATCGCPRGKAGRPRFSSPRQPVRRDWLSR